LRPSRIVEDVEDNFKNGEVSATLKKVFSYDLLYLTRKHQKTENVKISYETVQMNFYFKTYPSFSNSHDFF
jgi:hypothetical protein